MRISAAGQSQDEAPLVAVTGFSMLRDDRSTVRVPGEDADPAFVMSCSGTGTRPDGTTGHVTANLYIDSTSQQLVGYVWDK